MLLHKLLNPTAKPKKPSELLQSGVCIKKMKQPWFLIILVYICACANPIPPTGGPKDLDPPTLINTSPENKTLNFEGSEISLEFDEYIKEENLLTQLMITPNLRGPYTYRVNRNTIILNFEEPFDSATTYTFNFREGIKDITEGNVPPNLKFVLSTGSFLDSASVHGEVRSLMTQEFLEDITISLYKDPDTVTIFDGPPMYSTLTEDDGKFTIENIKNGDYIIYSIGDENRNLKLESRSEGYGFLDQNIVLSDSLAGIKLFIFKLDTRPIVLQNSRPIGKNYDLKFNKSLISYQLISDNESLVSNLVENNETLRVYFSESVQDSLEVRVIVLDSLQQSLDSLVYVKFEESTKKPDTFTSKINLKDGPVNKQLSAQLKFSKPVSSVNYDSIYFQFDSLHIFPLNDSLLFSDPIGDKFFLEIDFDTFLPEDSLITNWPDKFHLIISKGSFISVEGDSISLMQNALSFKDPKEFGSIRGTIITEHTSFVIQLVEKNFEVIEEITVTDKSIRDYEFLNITPGSYSIRILIDENNNGLWDPGNILSKSLPEKVLVFYHPNVESEVIKLRANWEQSGIDLSF